MLNNIPVSHLNTHTLIALCNYEWAKDTIINNLDKLPPRAWDILRTKPWAANIIQKN